MSRDRMDAQEEEKKVRRAKSQAPPNYQEAVKAREFLKFLKDHGISVEEEVVDDLSRQDAGEVVSAVNERLHHGVRLLLTNSKRVTRANSRDKLSHLLFMEGQYYAMSDFKKVEQLHGEIDKLLEEEARKKESSPRKGPLDQAETSENLEIDFYTHGWASHLRQVEESSSVIMGFKKQVQAMAFGSPEPRQAISQVQPQKITPNAKGNCNVISVGEAAGHDDKSLPKKVAQLERALTYVALRANTTTIEETVGYAALCMSTKEGASIGSAIVGLHANMFPLLRKVQKQKGLAYLFSRTSVDGSALNEGGEGAGGHDSCDSRGVSMCSRSSVSQEGVASSEHIIRKPYQPRELARVARGAIVGVPL